MCTPATAAIVIGLSRKLAAKSRAKTGIRKVTVVTRSLPASRNSPKKSYKNRGLSRFASACSQSWKSTIYELAASKQRDENLLTSVRPGRDLRKCS